MSTRNECFPGPRSWFIGLAVAIVLGLACGRAPAVSGSPPTDKSPAAISGSRPAYSARALADQAESALVAGHPGRAILELDRARLLAPRSATLSAEVDRARAAAGLPLVQRSIVRHVEDYLSPNQWAWLGILGCCGVAAAAVAFASGWRRRAGLAALFTGGALLAVLAFAAANETSPPPGRAVVVAAEVVARIGPFAQAEAAFSVPEGSEVEIERTFGDYVLVAGSDGRGWVPRHDVETILPPTGQRL
jgi:hypothetical protein